MLKSSTGHTLNHPCLWRVWKPSFRMVLNSFRPVLLQEIFETTCPMHANLMAAVAAGYVPLHCQAASAHEHIAGRAAACKVRQTTVTERPEKSANARFDGACGPAWLPNIHKCLVQLGVGCVGLLCLESRLQTPVMNAVNIC